MPSNSKQGLLRISYLARQLSDCDSGKSTRGMSGGRFQVKDHKTINLMVTQDNDLDWFGPLGSVIPYILFGVDLNCLAFVMRSR